MVAVFVTEWLAISFSTRDYRKSIPCDSARIRLCSRFNNPWLGYYPAVAHGGHVNQGQIPGSIPLVYRNLRAKRNGVYSTAVVGWLGAEGYRAVAFFGFSGVGTGIDMYIRRSGNGFAGAGSGRTGHVAAQSDSGPIVGTVDAGLLFHRPLR